jgi:arylsulfatase A-like enzyme
MTARFIDEVVAGGDCRLGILWLANPDLTTHHAPLGSPAHLEALRVVDGLVADVLAAVGAQDDAARTLVAVGSDHGHETIDRGVHVGDWLSRHGLASEVRDGKIAVAGQGTAALVYAVEEARVRLDAVLPSLRVQPWAGEVHTGDALAELGVGPSESLVVAIDMARLEQANPFGVVGSRWLAEDGESSRDIGCGQHGGRGPQETVPFLVLAVPGAGPGVASRPASLVDIAPTILDWLGVPAEGMDGRSLLG